MGQALSLPPPRSSPSRVVIRLQLIFWTARSRPTAGGGLAGTRLAVAGYSEEVPTARTGKWPPSSGCDSELRWLRATNNSAAHYRLHHLKID